MSKQRSRRKAFAPQRALPLNLAPNSSQEFSTEEGTVPFDDDAEELEEGEDDQDVEDENIFKGLQEEAGMCFCLKIFILRFIITSFVINKIITCKFYLFEPFRIVIHTNR